MAFELDPPEDDGLYIPHVGAWSAHKHHFLRRYIDIFTTGMKDRGWGGIHYIDLFAGAGIERIEGRGLDWGSPLIAAQAPNAFTQLHLCEANDKTCRALEKRIRRFAQPSPPRVFHADANRILVSLVEGIPEDALSLAFLDPYGLHLHFATLRVLAQRRIDLIIFFPDFLDALRNWERVYAKDPHSNLDQVLGTSEWRKAMAETPMQKRSEALRRLYEHQVATLGYDYRDFERITLPNGTPLYLLMFCSKHPLGREFWRKIATSKPGGQRSFDF